jgi:hypothetical protein
MPIRAPMSSRTAAPFTNGKPEDVFQIEKIKQAKINSPALFS